ncbi:MAG: hypothetical protein IJ410_06365 [Oscillospiraceae bacterium]|nr:hypothetical protein [Oscillospiraceae bacterium]
MKKIIAFIICISLCAGLAACSTASGNLSVSSRPAESGGAVPQVTATPTPTSTPADLQTPTHVPVQTVSDELMQLMENVIITAAPGTAGSSLKAVTAACDMVNWMAVNHPDAETIQLTVDGFMTTYTDKEEALWAFDLVESVYIQMKTDSAAMDSLLEDSGLAAEDFVITEDSMTATGRFFAAVDKYR